MSSQAMRENPPTVETMKAWLGGYGTTHTDTLYQQVTIPAGATASLTFFLHITTEEDNTLGKRYDTLKLQFSYGCPRVGAPNQMLIQRA